MNLSARIVFFCAFLFFYCSTDLLAQAKSSTLVLNSTLSSEEKLKIEQNSENAAQQLLLALQNNDVAAYSKFIPSKQTYEAMIRQFGFKTDAGLATALRDLDLHYDQEKTRILYNFNYIHEQLASIDNWSFDQYEFLLKENVFLKGGRSAMQIIEDKSAEKHRITFYKFYEYKGQWYVTNKLRWQS